MVPRPVRGEEERAVMRIVRVPVFHEGTFHAVLSAAQRAESCRTYRGESWEPIEETPRFGIYRRAPVGLEAVRERVETYEHAFYSRLLQERYGADGVLRPRTQVARARNGVLRVSPGSRRSSPLVRVCK